MTMSNETLPDDPTRAAPTPQMAVPHTHSVPVFAGQRSSRHRRVPTLALRVRAWRAARRHPRPDTFVQFAGFPRSGHSLIGALLDAHPNAGVAHELDAMGLFAKGVRARHLPGLCAEAAARFRADGQWWNGLSYEVPGAPPKADLRVIGDKKGDWATRWCARDETLWPRLRAATDGRAAMILVTRDPLDNIATLSLRQGRAYDRLRIETPREDFGAALRAAQDDGIVPAEASDVMIEDYAALCAATWRMRRQTPDADWHDVIYEAAQTDAEGVLSRLAAFLGLPDDPAWRRPAAALIRPGGRSRDKVRWRAGQRARVDEITRAYPFLAPYRDA